MNSHSFVRQTSWLSGAELNPAELNPGALPYAQLNNNER